MAQRKLLDTVPRKRETPRISFQEFGMSEYFCRQSPGKIPLFERKGDYLYQNMACQVRSDVALKMYNDFIKKERKGKK